MAASTPNFTLNYAIRKHTGLVSALFIAFFIAFNHP